MHFSFRRTFASISVYPQPTFFYTHAMRALIQRVKRAEVRVENRPIAQIASGLLIFLGVMQGDTSNAAETLADKILHLRIFDNDSRKMDRAILDTRGSILVVSQFTLCVDLHRGRRPSFDRAASPTDAKQLYEEFVSRLKRTGLSIATGEFGAMMEVELINDGPVTFFIDSEDFA